jgi:two-component system, LuxR family, response regulator FixJ
MNSPVMVAVIDDDDAFRESLARLVKSEGYQVIQFPSAEAFLAIHDREPLACAIVDLRMPGLNGIELQQKIKQILAHVAVVFLTGHAGIPDSVHAMKPARPIFLKNRWPRRICSPQLGAPLHRPRPPNLTSMSWQPCKPNTGC